MKNPQNKLRMEMVGDIWNSLSQERIDYFNPNPPYRIAKPPQPALPNPVDFNRAAHEAEVAKL